MPDFDFRGRHPTRALSDIHSFIERVCSIQGLSIGDWSDRSTWRIDFADSITPEQRAAAQQALMDFNYDDQHPEDVGAPRVIE